MILENTTVKESPPTMPRGEHDMSRSRSPFPAARRALTEEENQDFGDIHARLLESLSPDKRERYNVWLSTQNTRLDVT